MQCSAVDQVVVESHSGWGEMAVSIMGRIVGSLARQTGQREEEALRQTWGRLSITLQFCNAQILSNKIPYQPTSR